MIYSADYHRFKQFEDKCKITGYAKECELPYIKIEMEFILSKKLYSKALMDANKNKFLNQTLITDNSISISGKNISVVPKSIYFKFDHTYTSLWKNSEKIFIKLELDDLKKLLVSNYV